jgi:signal transduction histidine kinase/HPt (histidine-containing phosphotransfer) domain-containing protein
MTSAARRILVIDDNNDIHADFLKVFAMAQRGGSALDQLEADLFADEAHRTRAEVLPNVVVDSAYQGEEGIAMALEAARLGAPYYLAFVDVRMPPGIDGIQTIKRLWRQLPDLQCVVCTAYSDYAWEDIVAELGKSGNLLILKKPFDVIEVLHLAQALAEKVDLSRSVRDYMGTLERKVQELTRAEAALQRYNEELLRAKNTLEAQAIELARKSEQLEIARQEAEAANQAKSLFLATMSHELRTPLSGVIGMLDLLRPTELNAAQNRYIGTARTSAELLLRLINDILDFTKIEAGKLELEAIDLDVRATVEQVMELAAPQARKKGLTVRAEVDEDIPARLRGDPGRLRQVLTNLVANAVKFTHDGEVAVRAELVGQSDTYTTVRFRVTDTGIGIPPDRIGRLFQSFVQVDSSTTRKYGGTGLGLAICKRLCELMGGTIGVESTQGEGSTFWSTVVLEKQGAAVAEAPASRPGSVWRPPAAAPGKRARVLLAEDNEINQEVAVEILTRAGYQCDVVANGRLAVEAVARGGYDVVLMDCHMPEMDGFEATASIRRLEQQVGLPGRDGPVPIIAITANAMNGDRERCLEAGMTDYLCKPFNPQHVVQVIESNVSVAAAADAPAAAPEARDGAETVERSVLEPEELLARCMGDQEFATMILNKFRARLGDEVAQIERAFAARDAWEVKLLAHRLKSAAANVSAVSVEAQASNLEHFAKAGDWQAARPTLGALKEECHRLMLYRTEEPAAAGAG